MPSRSATSAIASPLRRFCNGVGQRQRPFQGVEWWSRRPRPASFTYLAGRSGACSPRGYCRGSVKRSCFALTKIERDRRFIQRSKSSYLRNQLWCFTVNTTFRLRSDGYGIRRLLSRPVHASRPSELPLRSRRSCPLRGSAARGARRSRRGGRNGPRAGPRPAGCT